jgi:hypothetical protein
VANVVDSWIVVKVKAERFCQGFCGTVTLVMMARIDLDRSSDTLVKAETMAREVKPMIRTTFGDSRQGMAMRMVVALCRGARHKFPPLHSSCMQYRTFLISGHCSYKSQICAVSSTSCFFKISQVSAFAQTGISQSTERKQTAHGCPQVGRHGLTIPRLHFRHGNA